MFMETFEMRLTKAFVLIALIASSISLTVALVALKNSLATKTIALSQYQVEEKNSLATPVFDEETNSWAFLAIFEISIANVSDVHLRLSDISPASDATGFILPLKAQDVVTQNIEYQAFLIEPQVKELFANPKLLKEIKKVTIQQSPLLPLSIDGGQTKVVRIGILADIYENPAELNADMLLYTFKFVFDNGKNFIFRRGMAVQPLKL
jgi:hypothetical protein